MSADRGAVLTAIRPRIGAEAVLATLAIVAITAAVNLQAPLYGAYAEAAGYGHGLRSLAFATYVLGLIPVLALCGGAADSAGRKPVLLAALAAATLATLVMTAWPSAQALFPARLLHGAAIALGLGSATAWLCDAAGGDARRSSSASALATPLGLGGGALLTGLVLSPHDLRPVSFPLALTLLAAVTAGIAALPAPPAPAPGARWLRWPAFPARTLRPGLANMLAWSASGVVVAFLPQVMDPAGHPAWTGVAVFLLCASGAAVQLLPAVATWPSRRNLASGAACSVAALAAFTAAIAWRSPGLALAAAAAAGLSAYGLTYRAGLAAVVAGGGDRRAAAVSGYMLLAYAGFGGPCLLVGVAAEAIGLVPALAVVGALIGAAFVAVARTPPPAGNPS